MTRFKKAAMLTTMFAAITLAGGYALAAYSSYMSWDAAGDGNLGNFDLDLQVNNGLSGGWAYLNATYGAHSATDVDGSGWFLVHSRLGFSLTSSSPQLIRNNGALNAVQTLTSGSSPFGMEARWVHETPTLAYNPAVGSKKWVGIWHTFVKSHPFDGDQDEWYIEPSGQCGDNSDEAPAGKNFMEYGWIALRGWNNSANAHPDPNLASLASHERRLFVGAGYNSTPTSTTSGWATGTPYDPFPSDGYVAYSEPGAFMDTDGTLYLAMTGNYCDGDEVYGDVVLVKSTDDGATWTAIGQVLVASDATNIDSDWAYFTASSMHRHSDGSVRLIVNGSRFNSVANGGGYEGIVEFKFSNLSTGTLVTTGSGDPAVQLWEAKETPVYAFTGAGTYNISTGKHIIHRLCTTGPPCPNIFTAIELNW